ncbi:F-box protein [Senna tora]|uniref:F-box protein n=1 Tax=Senna tora TaxID=362788 RepID=A0A834SWS0_9FABA|nr:F-box protein [Senna tora]
MSSQSCNLLNIIPPKPKPPFSPANIVVDNDDLLIEILLRLPIKSLLRFRSVSKHWLSLISNPQFSRLRTHVSPSGLILRSLSLSYKNPRFNFVDFNPNPINFAPSRGPFETLTFFDDPLGIKILQSCNGLLLCSSSTSEHYNFCKTRYYVYNPSTKQYSVLPPLNSHGGFWRVRGFCLAFDPSKSPHYKVVCLWKGGFNYTSRHLIEIYSSQDGQWSVSTSFTASLNVEFDCGVFWNGAVHWLNKWENSVYFKVDEEQVRDLPMPSMEHHDDGWNHRRIEYFGESNDHLHLIEIYWPWTTKFDVYEMKRDHSGWFVKYHVDLTSVSIAFPDIVREDLPRNSWNYYDFSIFSVIRGGPSGDSFLVMNIFGKVVRYNFEDRSFRKLGARVIVSRAIDLAIEKAQVLCAVDYCKSLFTFYLGSV